MRDDINMIYFMSLIIKKEMEVIRRGDSTASSKRNTRGAWWIHGGSNTLRQTWEAQLRIFEFSRKNGRIWRIEGYF